MGCNSWQVRSLASMSQLTDDVTSILTTVSRFLWHRVLKAILIIALIYVAWRIRLILAAIMVAVVITYIMLPIVNWMTSKKLRFLRKGDRRLFATVVVFFSFMAILVFVVNMFIKPFADEIKQFSSNFTFYVAKTGSLLEKAGTWYYEAVPKTVRDWISNLDTTNLVQWTTDYVQRMVVFLTSSAEKALELILIPVLTFYFLLDYKSITSEIYGLMPRKQMKDVMRIGHRLGDILQNYVTGQLILCAIAGILTGIFLWILGMPYVLVLALFAAITRAIPVIGPVVSGIPIVLVGLLYSERMDIPLILLIFITVMHFAESKFIMPRLIGDRLHLRPAIVIIVLLIGAEFFGLIGMFLAAPIAAIIRDVIRYYYIIPHSKKQFTHIGEG